MSVTEILELFRHYSKDEQGELLFDVDLIATEPIDGLMDRVDELTENRRTGNFYHQRSAALSALFTPEDLQRFEGNCRKYQLEHLKGKFEGVTNRFEMVTWSVLCCWMQILKMKANASSYIQLHFVWYVQNWYCVFR